MNNSLEARLHGAERGMKKISTMGEILVEMIATEIGQSFRQPGTFFGPYPSGAPAIFIDQVAKLGYPCSIIGRVGLDDFGYLNINRLRGDGVDVKGVTLSEDAVTGSAFVTYRDPDNRRFIFNIKNSASAQLSPDNVDPDDLEDCGHFHVMGSSLFTPKIVEAMMKAVHLVRANGGTISFDPNIRKEMLGIPGMLDALKYVLEFTDILLPSGEELTMLVKSRDEESAVEGLLDQGISEIVVKRGAGGATYFDRQGRFHMPALEVDECDPTGAGDCFGATFITCRKMGMDSKTSLTYAIASGANAVTKKGPMEGTATFQELDLLIERKTGNKGQTVGA